MNRALLKWLRCPSCRKPLQLHVFGKGAAHGDRTPPDGDDNNPEVVTGAGILLCQSCRVLYPVESGVPVILVFRTSFHDAFCRRYKAALTGFSDFKMPSGQPKPGEDLVQNSFTDEWDALHDNVLNFAYTEDDLVALNRRVWLNWAFDRQVRLETILDVGVGLGRETMVLNRLFPNSQIIGVDLGFALLRSSFVRNAPPNVHFVIASLFDLPLAPCAFDLVYSNGVIHHTYSTQRALEAISQFVASNKYLFIWVYDVGDTVRRDRYGNVHVKRRHKIERILRPWLSRAPKSVRDAMVSLITAYWHPIWKQMMIHEDMWTRANTEHEVRDHLTPHYAHRHNIAEVTEWFEQLGFTPFALQSSLNYRDLTKWTPFGIGVTGQKQ